MNKIKLIFIFMSITISAQAQFSSTSKTSWVYRSEGITLGTSVKYSSYGTAKLHIDKGFLRIGRSTGRANAFKDLTLFL